MMSLMCNEAQRSDNEGSLQISLFIAHKAVLDAYILHAFTTNKKGNSNGPIRHCSSFTYISQITATAAKLSIIQQMFSHKHVPWYRCDNLLHLLHCSFYLYLYLWPEWYVRHVNEYKLCAKGMIATSVIISDYV